MPKVSLTVAKELILAPLAHNDQRPFTSRRALDFLLGCLLPLRGAPALTPVAFDDIQSGLETVLNESSCETVVFTVMKFYLPCHRRSYETIIMIACQRSVCYLCMMNGSIERTTRDGEQRVWRLRRQVKRVDGLHPGDSLELVQFCAQDVLETSWRTSVSADCQGQSSALSVEGGSM